MNLSYGSALGLTGLREEQTYSLLLGQNKHKVLYGTWPIACVRTEGK